MNVIYKYSIVNHVTKLDLPKGAQIISVINQNGIVTVYALVDTKQETESVEFHIFGTGWDISEHDLDKLKFVGTVQIGWPVWHVFYKN